jgi:hypothetical protein
LTDGKGRVVDFKNTIIIMTSNIGSAFLQAEGLRSDEEFEKATQQVMNQLHAHFRPEFLNRVDDIIVFRPLGKDQLVKIIELRLEDVRRLLADRKISLELTDAAKDLLLTQGYDPNFGARPLKRAIQKLIQDPLALKILDGEILHGDHVVVDADKKANREVSVQIRVDPWLTFRGKCVNYSGRLCQIPSNRDTQRDLQSVPENRNAEFCHGDLRDERCRADHDQQHRSPARPTLQTKQSPRNERVNTASEQHHVRSGEFQSVEKMSSCHERDCAGRRELYRADGPEIGGNESEQRRNRR